MARLGDFLYGCERDIGDVHGLPRGEGRFRPINGGHRKGGDGGWNRITPVSRQKAYVWVVELSLTKAAWLALQRLESLPQFSSPRVGNGKAHLGNKLDGSRRLEVVVEEAGESERFLTSF